MQRKSLALFVMVWFLLVPHVSGSACVNSLFGPCQAASLHLRPMSHTAQKRSQCVVA